MTRLLAVLFAALLAVPAAGQDQPESYTILHCGHLLAVPGEAPLDNATLILRNGRVDSVLKDGATPQFKPGTQVQEIDLRDSFVLPGLIDCHVHLSMEIGPDSLLKRVTDSEADQTVDAVVFARRTLLAGFTTVRDLGCDTDAIFALRDGIRDGKVAGPRIVAAGKAISVTGGHGDPKNGLNPAVVGQSGTELGVADGPDECAKAIRYQVKRGADCIKIMATGGVLSVSNASLGRHFSDDEYRALVETATMMGRKVAAHAHGTTGINAALRAGVASIEHGTYLDDESIRLFKEKGAYLVPTLLAGATVAENGKKPGFYPRLVVPKALEVGPRAMAAFRKAREAGVKIAFGTDTGVSSHGQNAREFGLLVEGGMTPAEAIRAATVAAADLLGLSSEVGTLETGKAGDVIAVRGDPLTDVKVLEHITFVMREGVVARNDRP